MQFLQAILERLRANRASTVAVVGTASVAGAADSGFLESLPRGWFVAVVVMAMTSLMSAVVYFAKRDYTRIDETGKDTKREQIRMATEMAVFRTEVLNMLGILRADMMAELANCVKHDFMGASLGRLHEKINALSHDITIVEVHLGLHKKKRKEASDDDGSPEA